MYIEMPPDVHIFKPTCDSMNELWSKVSQYDSLFGDGEKDNGKFFSRILSPTSVVLETEDHNAILYMYDLIPDHVAEIHAVFFDKQLSRRAPVLMDCLTWAFVNFNLQRLEASIPVFAMTLCRVLEKKLHFTREGVLRKRAKCNGRFCDLIIFSLLREEHEEWVNKNRKKLDLHLTFKT